MLFSGKAKIERAGKHVTIVAYSKAVETALLGAEELAAKGLLLFYKLNHRHLALSHYHLHYFNLGACQET